MWRAMIYKELRELFGIAALGTAALLLMTSGEMRMNIPPLVTKSMAVPFLGSELYSNFTMVAVIFTVLIGFKQTAWELYQGTLLFLFHRPASRRNLILVKLATGLVLYLVCAALPILCIGVWAATPGTHPSPFEWSMTSPMWKLWLTMTVLQSGAFASGLLDGRWYGSRLLPLVIAGVMTFGIYAIPIPSISLALFVVFHAIFVTIILHTARTRDFS